MHIAVCDDDIAQRKQTERLLKREADKWIAKGEQVYIYSYGSKESLLANFMQFNAIFMDFTQTEGISIGKVIEDLRNIGATSMMVVCSEGKESDPELPKDTLFLPKPIRTGDLHEMMEHIKQAENMNIPMIELRGETETLYVKEPEIIRAEQSGMYTEVFLTQDRMIRLHGNIFNLFEDIQERHAVFVMPSKTSLINIRHVKDYRLGRVTMSDGTKYFATGSIGKYIKQILNDLEAGTV